VDKKAFHAIMIREMGLETIRKFMCGERIKPDDYRPVKMSSEFARAGLLNNCFRLFGLFWVLGFKVV
jgi:hypothetical protein